MLSWWWHYGICVIWMRLKRGQNISSRVAQLDFKQLCWLIDQWCLSLSSNIGKEIAFECPRGSTQVWTLNKNGAEKKKRGMFTFLTASPLLALSLSLSLTNSLARVFTHRRTRAPALHTLSHFSLSVHLTRFSHSPHKKAPWPAEHQAF